MDAIQYILGTTAGKGNLVIERKGKMAFTLIDRSKRRAFRAYLEARSDGMDRAGFLAHLLEAPFTELFSVTEVPFDKPARAYRYPNHSCASCKESTAEYALKVFDGDLFCGDCYAVRIRDTFM